MRYACAKVVTNSHAKSYAYAITTRARCMHKYNNTFKCRVGYFCSKKSYEYAVTRSAAIVRRYVHECNPTFNAIATTARVHK
jgi:hypothetical protein